MTKYNLLHALGVAVCALAIAFSLSAADQPASKAQKPSAPPAVRHAWPPETISGKIMTVDPAQRLLILQNDGVPFDMRVTPATRIEVNNKPVKLGDLKADTNRNVSVRFVPERSGDIARAIRVG